MPHTHPLYKQMFTSGDDPELHDSCDKRHMPLHAALAEAQLCTVDELRYYAAPVPGTEPRYRLSCNADGYGDMTATAHLDYNGGAPLPWRKATVLYQRVLAENGVNPSHWYGLVAA